MYKWVSRICTSACSRSDKRMNVEMRRYWNSHWRIVHIYQARKNRTNYFEWIHSSSTLHHRFNKAASKILEDYFTPFVSFTSKCATSWKVVFHLWITRNNIRDDDSEMWIGKQSRMFNERSSSSTMSWRTLLPLKRSTRIKMFLQSILFSIEEIDIQTVVCSRQSRLSLSL